MYKQLMILAMAWLIFMIAMPVQAETIKVEALPMEVTSSYQQKQLLSRQPIELKGPIGGMDFFYTITEQQLDGENKVSFDIRYSKLLIAPSTFSIAVDDVTIESVALTNEQIKNVTVTLPKRALKKGTHKITASFNGLLKEGICAAPGELGNWLVIEMPSYLSLNNTLSDEITLEEYPASFIPTKNRTSTLIIPNEGSLALHNRALQVAAFLSKQGTANVQIVREGDYNNITGPVILLGAKEQFTTAFAKQVIKEAGNYVQVDVLQQQQSVPVLKMIGDTEERAIQNSEGLVNVKMYEQWHGQKMPLDVLPTFPLEEANYVTFQEIGIQNLELATGKEQSIQYYYSFPKLEKGSKAYMNVKLRKADVIPTTKDERKVELIMYINQVPIAYDLSKLKDDKEGYYNLKLPIPIDALNEKTVTALHFEVTGFTLSDPCEITNERYWIYIDEQSTISWQPSEETTGYSLRDFPTVFTEGATIVVPKQKNTADSNALVELYKSLIVNGQVAKTTLQLPTTVSAEELKQPLLLIGDANELEALDKDGVITKLIEKRQQFFIDDEAKNTVMIQENHWAKNKPLVLFTLADLPSQKQFFTTLLEVTQNSEIAVQLGDNPLMFSPAQQEQSTQKKNKLSVMALVPIFIIGLLLLIVILYLLAKRKKRA